MIKSNILSKLSRIGKTVKKRAKVKQKAKLNEIKLGNKRVKYTPSATGKIPRPSKSLSLSDARGKYTYLMPLSQLNSPKFGGIYK